MTIESILVATDLSAQENMAIQRASRLAHAHRATVKLMYLPPRGQQVPGSASARLANAASKLQRRLALRVEAVPTRKHKLEDLAAQASGMDLVVLPHRRERSTAAFFRGQPVLRLLRGCSCPVLVTRQVRSEHYRHIIVAVDFSAESEALVKLATELDARAELQVFHAIATLGEDRLRSAEATERAIRAYRERCLRDAQERMLTLTDSFQSHGSRLVAVIRRGDPGTQTVFQQQHSDADLVVLGKRRTSAWEDFFCGSVAHRVLSWGSSDVLLVPQGEAQPSARLAAHRIGNGRPALDVAPAERRWS
jgi:nucleotide-binding universal stress UspA family protein